MSGDYRSFIAQAKVTASATDQVLLSVDADDRVSLVSILVTADDANTVKPDVTVKVGSRVVAEHPGVPNGGGFSWEPKYTGAWGEDITFSSTGGTVSVSVSGYLRAR